MIKSTQRRSKRKKVEKTPYNWTSIIISIIALIISGLAAYFVYLQTKNTTKAANAAELAANTARTQFDYQKIQDSENRIIQDTKDASFALSQQERDSLNRVSVKLTRENIELVGKNAKIDLCPYIVINSDTIDVTCVVDHDISAVINVTNFGKTPALDFTHINFCIVADSMTQSLLDDLFAAVDRHKNTGFALGSNQSFPKKGFYSIFSRQDSINIFSSKKKLIIAGVISYSDVFMERHWIWYCMEDDRKRNQFIDDEKYTGRR